MSTTQPELCIEVWGDLACFTRPEMKVERFSYPIITPSAARGVFDAIYCKPKEFRWQITKVEMLSEPKFIALRRNEVKEKISVRDVSKWIDGKQEPTPVLADLTGADKKGRTQRQTMALKDVSYLLYAQICPWPGFESRRKAFIEQFRRRAEHGKCFYQPYFGCREFPAYFKLITERQEAAQSVPMNMENIGLMLYDVFDLSRSGHSGSKPAISLFRPQIVDGVMKVPDYSSDETLKTIPGGI